MLICFLYLEKGSGDVNTSYNPPSYNPSSYNPPPGYLKCNGETINNGNTTFPLVGSPDLSNNWITN